MVWDGLDVLTSVHLKDVRSTEIKWASENMPENVIWHPLLPQGCWVSTTLHACDLID